MVSLIQQDCAYKENKGTLAKCSYTCVYKIIRYHYIDIGTSRSTAYSKLKEDEEDFDKFLKSVKSKQLSHTNSADTGGTSLPNPLHSITSDDDLSEEEVDFGYWESASLPSSSKRVETNLKDIDLNLL